MAFCSQSADNNEVGFTVVDNLFITQFMAGAPKHCIEVYLFGLSLCKEHESTNTLEVMERALDLTRDDIIDAYGYWEELGLVHVASGGAQIIYLPIRADRTLLKKIKSSKYSDFTTQIQSAISGRMITTNEYNEYFMFLETSFFDPAALVHVAKYCVELKGNNISYNYILTVARNLANGGVKSLEAVQEKLQEHVGYNDDISLIFKNLHIRRSIEYGDKEKYERWSKNFGFTLDTIINVAKNCKVGGMDKLDSMLEEYYSMNLMSTKEIDDYVAQKQSLLTLAKDINKSIGVYYQSLDVVVQEYVTPWTQKGFGGDTLILVAKYCFKNSIRTLQGMNNIIEKFYKLGLTTIDGINQYLEQVLYRDNQIKNVLDKAGIVRNVTAPDRTNFRTWTEQWNISYDVIMQVAEQAATANNPINYLNKVLSDFYSKGINSLEQLTVAAKPAAKKAAKYPQRDYSNTELQALFANLDDIEV